MKQIINLLDRLCIKYRNLDVYVEAKTRGFLESENYKIIIPFEHIVMIETVR